MQLENPIDRTITFYSDVTPESIAEVVHAINSINEHDEKLKKTAKAFGMKYDPKPIILLINSYGGHVYPCLGLIGIMRNSETPIHTYVSGCAMSAAFIIAICGHKRFCYQESSYMLHEASNMSWGKIQERVEGLQEDSRLQKILNDIILQNTNITKKQLKKIFKSKRDKFYSGEEAQTLGCVDVVI
jgi:ATP-dependent Clp protease protease subunit